jgi:hypothetical protein
VGSLGVILNRKEAVQVLKEMFEECTLFDGTYIALMPPNSANLLSHGYQVHIKVPIDNRTQQCMQKIAEKNKCTLIIKNKEDVAIIYRPKK